MSWVCCVLCKEEIEELFPLRLHIQPAVLAAIVFFIYWVSSCLKPHGTPCTLATLKVEARVVMKLDWVTVVGKVGNTLLFRRYCCFVFSEAAFSVAGMDRFRIDTPRLRRAQCNP